MVFNTENVLLLTVKYSCCTDYRQGPLFHFYKAATFNLEVPRFVWIKFSAFNFETFLLAVNSCEQRAHWLVVQFFFLLFLLAVNLSFTAFKCC